MTRTLAYPPSPRRDTYGSMASAAIGNPRPAHVAAFFDRNDYTSPGRRPRSIQGNVTFPASTRRRSKTCRDPFAASSMTAQSRCSSTSLPPWMAHNGLALSYCGRWEEGDLAARRALRLSPRDPLSALYYGIAAYAQFLGRNYSEAIRLAREGIRQRSDFVRAHRVLTAAAGMAGQDDITPAALQ